VYQWDLNHELLIQGVKVDTNAPTIHFCNKKSENAIVVQSEFVEGAIKVSVPNQLLQEPYDIIAYVHTYDDNNAKTIEIITIPLVRRPKPDDYIFTENVDIMNFERLESDIVDFINLMTSKYDLFSGNILNRLARFKTEMDMTLQACRDAIASLQLEWIDMDGGIPTTDEYLETANYNGGYPL
jgi:hypothetical protein